MAEVSSMQDTRQEQEPFLTIAGQPVYFHEDWDTGIGGGLWSTGLALGRYFQTPEAANSLKLLEATHSGPLRVLELGSGNGFLSACFLALMSKSMKGQSKVKLVITDTDDHLDMIRQTMAANAHLLEDNEGFLQVDIVQHMWGKFDNGSGAHLGSSEQFDLILGSDLAYREELYEPLIASYATLAGPDTVILLGVTMLDTTPEFFDRLEQSGFEYERFADHLVEADFRGTTFGIFVIRKKAKA